ncbi:response regulator receiver domain-containing protein [Geodermatophilus tzadiensis]|uniref:Response regulator receiver domain-containing protein n=1 Tax=Geodermatophilus tzadiensis TaxID=1137988 RepID=A0A2T0TX36_9ACTN|nr:response regulator [Geodermatophilus tzadiensis]PRY50231.1 response regulator receiver domain-containing protein [Geodermatophilus tzadiensis]
MPIRVLIVDDHPSFRSLARRLLVDEGFDVVGEAGDGRGALQAAGELRPDLVLLDVQLPDVDGFGVAAALAGQPSPPEVVLVSSRSRADYGQRVGSSGTRGFIAKAELSGALLRQLLTGGRTAS